MTTYPAQSDTTSTALTTLGEGFGENPIEVVRPTLQPNPQLVWMTGNLSTTTLQTAVGWHVPAEVNPELDELLTARGAKRYIVQHKTGDVRQKPYWALNWEGQPCSLIVIANGLKSSWQMKKRTDDRAGIAYGVGVATERDGTIKTKKDGTPKQKPMLAFRAFIHELMDKEHPEEGFNEWFQVSLSNYIVDDMLVALNEQFRVLEAYNGCMAAMGKKNRAVYWGFSIPMVPGDGKEVGPKDEDKSTIYPMVTQIPQLRVGDAATVEYLNRHRIPLHIQDQLIGEGMLLDETIVWSAIRSLEIVEGKQDEASITTVTEVVEPEPYVDAAPVLQLPTGEQDRLCTPQELTWIANGYCLGNPNFLKDTCVRFGVRTTQELRLSHYTTLQFESSNYTESAAQ